MNTYNKIIFVCMGNTCRSPMAATIMQNRLSKYDVIVESRGMVVLFEEPYNPKAVAVAASHNMIMPSNNAIQIANNDFGKDTLVLVMNASMKQKLYDSFDRAINVYTLCEFCGEPEEEVQDPYGKGIEEYNVCFEQLQHLVDIAADNIINNIKQEEYKTLIKLALFVFSIIPSINVFGDEFGTNSGYSLIWFVVLYFIGAYLKIYGLKKRKYLKWYCSICIGLFIIKYICDMVGLKKSFVKAIPNLLIKYNSIFIIIASICLFCGMVGSTIKVGDKIEKQIIILSQASLGVYLLHENREFRMLLWNRIVNLKRFSEMPILFGGYIIVSAVVIFFIGIVCEMSRKSLMDLLKKRVKKNLSTVKFSFAKKVYGRKLKKMGMRFFDESK